MSSRGSGTMPVSMREKPAPHPWFALPLLILIFAVMAMPVQGLEKLQVTIDGQPVRNSITMSYSGPEGDPVSALTVKVTGVSGVVRFVIDPANSQGCKNGEWEHASRDLMVAHDEQANYYRAPASDWHPCSSARLGVIHDDSGQEVWWTVNFQGATGQPSELPKVRELTVAAYDGTDTAHMPLTFWIRLTEGGTPVKGERVEFKFDPEGVHALADRYAIWDAKNKEWSVIEDVNLASETTDKSAATDENGLIIIRVFLHYARMRDFSIALPFSLEFTAMAPPGSTPLAPLEKKASLNIANGVFIRGFYYITPQGELKYISDLDDVSDYAGQASTGGSKDWMKDVIQGSTKSDDRDPPRSRVLEKIQLQPDGLRLPDNKQFYLPVKSGQTLIMDARIVPPKAGLAAAVMWLDGSDGLFAINNREAVDKGSFLAVRLMGGPVDKSLSAGSRLISFAAGQGTDWVVKTAVVAGATLSGGPVAGTCAAYILESYQSVMDLKELDDITTQNARLILINSIISLTSEPDGKMTLYTFEGSPAVVDASGDEIVAQENEAIDFTMAGEVYPAEARSPPARALAMLAAIPEDVPSVVEEGPEPKSEPKDEGDYSGENPPTSKDEIPQQESTWKPVPENENIALGKQASQSSTTAEWGGNWDASRGVDGVKTGNLFEGGFHTDNEQNPWWQVDLGSIYKIAEVRIYNRLDCCNDRAKTIEVLLSEDGKSWRKAYSHDGSTIGGADGNYLRVNVDGERARYVRVQLQETNWLHLDEVEVYARGGSWDGTGAEPPEPGTNVGESEGGSQAGPLNPEGSSPEGLNSDILGEWTIYSGGQAGTPEEWDARYRGTLSLSSWERTYQGTVMYDIYQTEEELTDVTYQDGVLRFIRPPFLGRDVPQFFEATVEGERMEGTFSEEGDSRQWRWWGTLDSRSNGEIEVFL